MNKEITNEEIDEFLDVDFDKFKLVVSRIYKEEYVIDLEQKNEELQERIKKYEDPEDLTLMFMYCDEKAKDKIKELKERINKAIEYIKNENLRIVDITKDIPELCDIELLKILRGE